MPRLQQIKRANGSVVHSVNIPLELIEASGWKKGDELRVINIDEATFEGGEFVVVISKEKL